MESVATLLARSDSLLQISESAALDTELLLAYVLNVDRTWLKTWPSHQPAAEQTATFEQLLLRRLKGEPIAFIIGTQGFWTLDLNVSPQTLIPRPETELLVETALEIWKLPICRALDLGTGSGAIALALASERPNWQLTAVDSIEGAVQLAEINRQNCQLENVEIYQSDWFREIPKPDGGSKYHLIISNPPYIEAGDPHLQQGDVRFEPESALVSGLDGLHALTHIIRCATDYLEPTGWLLVEHGYQQAADVRDLFSAAGFTSVQTEVDLNFLDRVTLGCLP
ncbi:MAG: peptide chain release factor N(5)-glutamine methyltransferase [Porticoccaceae bacterium]|nr:peptide chain release factor N(5)-glutamine methyltransferase [Porticoccaceae bacterium]MDG1475274.1 peptide chain release factor N(5)-glutamine methyltransferase [Porticoccaceae bacterium]